MDTQEEKIIILYVEDEEGIREGLSKTIRYFCDELIGACDGLEGLKLYKEHNPDIIVTDIKMPNMNGIDMAKEILKISPDIPIVFTTVHNETSVRYEVLELQVDGYLLQPVLIKSLIDKINKFSKNISMEKINKMQYVKIQEQKDI